MIEQETSTQQEIINDLKEITNDIEEMKIALTKLTPEESISCIHVQQQIKEIVKSVGFIVGGLALTIAASELALVIGALKVKEIKYADKTIAEILVNWGVLGE